MRGEGDNIFCCEPTQDLIPWLLEITGKHKTFLVKYFQIAFLNKPHDSQLKLPIYHFDLYALK